MAFASVIDNWCKKVPVQINNIISYRAAGVFNQAVEFSPNSPTRIGKFSTGIVKGNWYTGLNSFNTSFSQSADPSGATSYSRIKSTLAMMPWLGKDASVTLSNSAPYILFVERIGWPKNYPNPSGWKWSGRVGPYAMVQTAITNFKGVTP